MRESKLSTLQPYALSILRIVAGFVFMPYGMHKLFGFWSPDGAPMPAGTLLWYAGLIETIGGALILLGLFTVPVAFILCGQMAVAYFMGHAPKGLFLPVNNGGTPAVLFCFLYLYLFLAGAGPWSLDHVIVQMRRRP